MSPRELLDLEVDDLNYLLAVLKEQQKRRR